MSETPSMDLKTEKSTETPKAGFTIQDEPVQDPGPGSKTPGTLPVMGDDEE